MTPSFSKVEASTEPGAFQVLAREEVEPRIKTGTIASDRSVRKPFRKPIVSERS
jgi:hypothetical protein